MDETKKKLAEVYQIYKMLEDSKEDEVIDLSWLNISDDNMDELMAQVHYLLSQQQETTFYDGVTYGKEFEQRLFGRTNVGSKHLEIKSVLEDLYHGDIHPEENIKPLTRAYEKFWESRKHLHETFINQLSEPLKNDFIAIMDKELQRCTMDLTQVFVQGYKLGSKITLETFAEF